MTCKYVTCRYVQTQTLIYIHIYTYIYTYLTCLLLPYTPVRRVKGTTSNQKVIALEQLVRSRQQSGVFRKFRN
jgi:hypothetical protein